jgi:hypothetical protein
MIIILLFILILLLYLSKKEHFNVVNQHNLYTNYRNYIDDNYKNTFLPHNHLYQISDNCFVDHVNRCIGNKKLCQMYSLHKCVGPSRIT